MKTLEVVVIYIVAYASLIVVVAIALYMIGLEMRDRRRAHAARETPTGQPR